MADIHNPSDPEQTLLAEEPFDPAGEPAPPLPVQHTTPVSRTEPLGISAGTAVADQPTRTDPALVVPSAQPRTTTPRRVSSRRTTGRPRKNSKTPAGEGRQWQGSRDEYRSVDLIDAFRAAGQRGGGRFHQRVVNLGVFASIVLIMMLAHWAGRPALTVATSTVVEMEEPAPESLVSEAVPPPDEPATTAMAAPSPDTVSVPSVPTAAVVQEAAVAAPSAASPTPETPAEVAPSEAVPLAAGTASLPASPPTDEAPTAVAVPPQPMHAAAVVVTTPDAIPPPAATATTPTTPAPAIPVAPTTVPVTVAQEIEPADDKGAVDVAHAAPLPTKRVAVATQAKRARHSTTAARPKPAATALPEQRGDIPYNSGGPLDLDNPSTRAAYHELNRAVVSRDPGSRRNTNPSTSPQAPTPPTTGTGKAIKDLDAAYERQFTPTQ